MTLEKKVIRKEPCPKCREKGRDRSGDNLVVYSDQYDNISFHCFSCGYTKASIDYKKETYKDRYLYELQMAGEFTIDMWKKFKETTRKFSEELVFFK